MLPIYFKYQHSLPFQYSCLTASLLPSIFFNFSSKTNLELPLSPSQNLFSHNCVSQTLSKQKLLQTNHTTGMIMCSTTFSDIQIFVNNTYISISLLEDWITYNLMHNKIDMSKTKCICRTVFQYFKNTTLQIHFNGNNYTLLPFF